MKIIQYTTSPGVPHRSMGEEFLCHQQNPEWWYATGYLMDEAGKMFSYQFTLAKLRIYGLKLHFLITALTDFETGQHYYAQQPIFFEKNVIITAERVGVNGTAEMTFGDRILGLNISGQHYSLVLDMNAVKPPVWHCDNGVLKMGIDGQWTFYWSYTNLALSGKLLLDGQEHQVTGKGWFDKQGGPYSPLDRRTSWEWFSLRFFDNEEIMLFTFPQDHYQDGTYIEKSGEFRRLQAYALTPLGFTQANGKKFSYGWQVDLTEIKDQAYTIIPKIDGQLNGFFFELLADIKDNAGNLVGYGMVELLPGVYNQNSAWDVFKRI
jgi:predicted secreted hydrolase